MIVLGDTIEEMSKLQDKSIDLILCDLPYGVTNHREDKLIPLDKLWEQYNRIIKDNGSVILFAQGLFYVDLVNSNRKNFRYDLVWDKVLVSGFLDANRKPLRVHEQVCVFQKFPRKCTYNPQLTIGRPLHGKGHSYKNKEVVNQNYGDYKISEDKMGNTKKYPKSIISFQKPHPSKALHRTEKPIECLEWLIKTYSNENDVVLDNTCGSGSTAIACLNTGRRYICIDNSEHYISVANNRIKNYKIEIQR